jgi:hypothetical protein
MDMQTLLKQRHATRAMVHKADSAPQAQREIYPIFCSAFTPELTHDWPLFSAWHPETQDRSNSVVSLNCLDGHPRLVDTSGPIHEAGPERTWELGMTGVLASSRCDP